MWQTDPELLSETGIEISVQPPGKKMMPLTALSGGERAMTAAALIFALIEVKPSPFYLLDEVDAALDDANVERFSQLVRELGKRRAAAARHAQQEDDGARRAHVRRHDVGARDLERSSRPPSSPSKARRPRRRRLPAELREAALISVYDRTGIVELAETLVRRGAAIFATGGTRAHLLENGIPARDVGELTGFPALFDGRVKTLHPRVFGGILLDRSNPGHDRERREHGIPRLDDRGREPLSVRSDGRARGRDARGSGRTDRHRRRRADPRGGQELRARDRADRSGAICRAVVARRAGAVDVQARRRFATRAFERTAEYDSAIARYLEAGLLANELPGSLALTLPIASAACATGKTRSRAPPSTCRAPSICPSNSAARRSRTTTCSIWMRRCGCWCARPSRRPSRSARRRRRCARRSSSTPFPAAWRNAPRSREATRARARRRRDLRLRRHHRGRRRDRRGDRRGARRILPRNRRRAGVRGRRARAFARAGRTCGSCATTRGLPERLAKEAARPQCAGRRARRGRRSRGAGRRAGASSRSVRRVRPSGATCASPGTSCGTSRATAS